MALNASNKVSEWLKKSKIFSKNMEPVEQMLVKGVNINIILFRNYLKKT